MRLYQLPSRLLMKPLPLTMQSPTPITKNKLLYHDTRLNMRIRGVHDDGEGLIVKGAV